MAVYLEGKDDSKEGRRQGKSVAADGGRATVVLHDIIADSILPSHRRVIAKPVWLNPWKNMASAGLDLFGDYFYFTKPEYVTLDNKRFYPTDVGRIVNKFLTEHFTKYVDYDFTANLEDDLDAVSRGEKDWIPLMNDFWRPFTILIQRKR